MTDNSLRDRLNEIRKQRDLSWATTIALAYGNHVAMSRPVALIELESTGVTHKEIGAALRARKIGAVTRHIYAEADSWALDFLLGMQEGRPRPLSPVPSLLAEALARQHRWKLGIGSELCAVLCGYGDNPEYVTTVGYDQVAPCKFGELMLEPMRPELIELPIAAQVLVLGLQGRLDGTEEALVYQGQLLGKMPAWRQLLADQIAPALDVLPTQLCIVALAIREQVGKEAQPALRRCPPGWNPPPEGTRVAKVEGWSLETVVGPNSGIVYEALSGFCINHPFADPCKRFQSSAILWIDEKMGWARAQSRLYKLGSRG
ncbi:MAG: hypothetical protein HQL44_09345 [Alphaproteobacteria bacterium]|nr:hypothetical protein [Alphaproteobacteria bacterium]